MAQIKKHQFTAHDGSEVIVKFTEDDNGLWNWEVNSEVWNEVQPPDTSYEICLADFHENMTVYASMRVEYSDQLLKLSSTLVSLIRDR